MSNKKKGLLFIIVPIIVLVTSIFLFTSIKLTVTPIGGVYPNEEGVIVSSPVEPSYPSNLLGSVLKITYYFFRITAIISNWAIFVCIPIGIYFLLRKDKKTVEPKSDNQNNTTLQ